MRPTAACERLLPAIRALLKAGENCAQLSAQIRGADVGTVTIGTAYSAFYTPLSRVISAFHARYPGIQVQLSGSYSTDLLARLNRREIDFCIISEREGTHRWHPILRDEMTAWLPAAHPLASLPAFPVSAFAEESYIETPILQFSTMDSLATYSMVEAGLGLSMNNAINGRAWSGNVRILPLDPPQKVEIGIACLDGLSPAAETFFEFLRPQISSLA